MANLKINFEKQPTFQEHLTVDRYILYIYTVNPLLLYGNDGKHHSFRRGCLAKRTGKGKPAARM